MVVVDSSVWIEYLRNPASAPSLELDRLLTLGEVVVTGVVIAEVLQGARSDRGFERMSRILNPLQYEDLDKDGWNTVAGLSFRLLREGNGMPLSDLQIAVVALNGGHDVFTLDHHFSRVPQLKLHQPGTT